MKPASTGVEPGSELKVDVGVTGPDGNPAAGSEVALVVVDEAILALTGYTYPDPLELFYPEAHAGVSDYHLREHVVLASMDQLDDLGERGPVRVQSADLGAAGEAAPMAKNARGRNGGDAIAMREDFRPLAYFGPRLTTGKDGRATAKFELPDNLTRWRLFAVAVDGKEHFGKGESTVTARLPLTVRPSMPRFLNWGDTPELPLSVHNQTDSTRTVKLAGRAENLKLTGAKGLKFDVKAGERVEVRMPAATEKAGRARLQFAVASQGWADAAEVDFPVWTPATTEAFATYGTLDGAEDDKSATLAQPVSLPDSIVEQFGGLEITTSSTALQQLTDAFLYLVEYRFACTEQVASRMLGVAALADVLSAFEAEGMPDKKKLKETMAADIDTLVDLQNRSGGFGLWRADGKIWPYASVHATHALWKVQQAGYEVPPGVLDRAIGYLESIEGHIPAEWSEKARNTVHAYALYVLAKIGKSQHDEAIGLAQKSVGDTLSLEAAGWVMASLAGTKEGKKAVAELERQFGNRVEETASTAHFATSYGRDQGYLIMHSNRRADAVVLDAMISAAPKSDLIPKVVRGLLAHRKKGRWSNTQENVFVLLALERYFEKYEAQTPDFVARMWLGDGYVGEHAFKGRSAERKHVDIPMKAVAEQISGQADDDKDGKGEKTADLVLQKTGKGRLYYRIGMSYAPESLDLDPAEYGFAVERRYEAVDEEDDVRRREDGTWVVEAGARVRVRLTMAALGRRTHVALVDPLAAGFEPINPELKTTGSIPDDPKDDDNGIGPYWWWHRPWYEHQNLRDERAEAFASLVHGGVYNYSYVVRATTPGEFVVPPAKAEEMYHPETFGRTGTARVVVK